TDPKCLVRFAMTRDMSRKPTHEPIAPARGRSGQERVRPRPPPPERLGTASSQLLEVRLPRVVPVPELFGFAAPELLGFAVLDERLVEARIAEARVAEARVAEARVAEARVVPDFEAVVFG